MYRCFDVLVYCCTGPYVYSVRVRVGIGDGPYTVHMYIV